ncbi:integrator complex subunit 2-like [Watersipora subatra]|uniref:integrator complex subunit 2-like n=1 Tax=Watersipora subatra TaxID=2589382 RepID=UPI00355B5312
MEIMDSASEVKIDRTFFDHLESFDIYQILKCDKHIYSVLPLLTRCCLCSSSDISQQQEEKKQKLMKTLLNYDDVNFLIESLSTDFNQLSIDCISQLSLRSKKAQFGENVFGMDETLTHFESYSVVKKFRVVVTEVKWLMLHRPNKAESFHSKHGSQDNSCLSVAPILQLPLFRQSVTDLLCIALHELPFLLPMCEVVDALLYVDNSLDMIMKVLINSPWSVTEVCCHLIKSDDEIQADYVRQTRVTVIKHICHLSPSIATLAAKTCVAANKLPHLLAWIYLNQDGEETTVAKLAEFVFTHRRVAKSLLLSKTTGEESPLLAQCRRTIDRELDYLITTGVSHENANSLSTLIRLCCTLREMVVYKFSDAELEKIFRLFPFLPLNTEKATQLMILALCLTIASIHQMAPYSAQLSSWLRSLSRNTTLFTQSSDTSMGQFLLLIAIYYHGNQLTTISDMVAAHLNIKPSAVKLSNTILKQIITYEVFTEQVISQLTVLLSVTKDLNGNMKGYLPIHCVCQLLKSRAFSKHNVSIAEWITSQLKQVSLPLHPMVPQMVSLYIASTIPQQHNVRSANPQLDEQTIREHFQLSQDEHFISQLVFLYYVLCHQDAVHSEPVVPASKKRPMMSYSNSLISSIPVKRLVSKAYEYRHQCGSLYPSLVKLLYTNIPQMCRADMWLPDKSIHRRPNPLVRQFQKLINNEELSKLDPIHKQYIQLRLVAESLSENTLPVLMESLRLVHASSKEQIPRHMTMVLAETWLAYSRIAPERLYPETVNVLRGYSQSLNEDQLIIDPLLVLQCLHECKNPDILTIVLHLVGVYSRASNRYYNIHCQNRGSTALTESQEICYSLLSAQESATLQIMLEHCLPDIQRGESILCDQREIQTLICSDVHKLIINNPYQAKLISFQGYDRRLIPIAIAGIPSMHICLDYVPELLAQPDINKQVFAVRLVASLCQQYGVHKTFTMARLSINTLHTLVGVLPTRSVIADILPVLPDVITICQNMPVLYDDWIKLLAKILPVVAACRGEAEIDKQKSKVLTLGVNG